MRVYGCGMVYLGCVTQYVTITQCGSAGVVAANTKGRLINCVITQCKYSGIWCGENALIELEGTQRSSWEC